MSVGLRSRPRRALTRSVRQARLLRTRLHRFVRPAPPGARAPAPPDSPPDGWRLVSVSPADALLVLTDRGLLWVSDSIARQVPRRTFLTRVGQVGLVVGLTGARVLLRTEEGVGVTALPCNVCTDPGENDNNPAACGPSEPCGNQECRSGDNRHLCNLDFECNSPPRSVEGREWGRSECTTNQGGKWDECCGGQLAICRDCCGCRTHASGQCVDMFSPFCTNQTRWKCICDKQTTTPCTVGGTANC